MSRKLSSRAHKSEDVVVTVGSGTMTEARTHLHSVPWACLYILRCLQDLDALEVGERPNRLKAVFDKVLIKHTL